MSLLITFDMIGIGTHTHSCTASRSQHEHLCSSNEVELALAIAQICEMLYIALARQTTFSMASPDVPKCSKQTFVTENGGGVEDTCIYGKLYVYM